MPKLSPSRSAVMNTYLSYLEVQKCKLISEKKKSLCLDVKKTFLIYYYEIREREREKTYANQKPLFRDC